jgi:hypothetical protein
LSILAILLLLCGGHGAKFLAGHLPLFASPGGGRQRQPALALEDVPGSVELRWRPR